MPEIKIFVCCHQPCEVPKHPLLVPLQVGAALADTHFPGFLHDDTGDNISTKNRSYCELTAQYWAWKNVEADYYGFFHYRRYLYPDAKAKAPYRIERAPDLLLLNKLGFESFSELIQLYDLIAPKGEDMHLPVWEHYANAKFHHTKDLELVENIVRQRTSEMIRAMENYLSGTINYFGNIFVMRREIFWDYCSWLFPVLEQFDATANLDGYNDQERRVDGYIAERLFGIYLTDRREKLNTLELPRVHFYGNSISYIEHKLLNTFLPPSSSTRSTVKAIHEMLVRK